VKIAQKGVTYTAILSQDKLLEKKKNLKDGRVGEDLGRGKK